jgi:hypothetical protein
MPISTQKILTHASSVSGASRCQYEDYIVIEEDSPVGPIAMSTHQPATTFFVERRVGSVHRRIQLGGPPDPGEPYDLLAPATRVGSSYELRFLVNGKPKVVMADAELLRDFQKFRPSLYRHSIFLAPKMDKIWPAVLAEMEIQ